MKAIWIAVISFMCATTSFLEKVDARNKAMEKRLVERKEQRQTVRKNSNRSGLFPESSGGVAQFPLKHGAHVVGGAESGSFCDYLQGEATGRQQPTGHAKTNPQDFLMNCAIKMSLETDLQG